MFKFVDKIAATILGNPPAGGHVFHESQTCGECGTRLMRTEERTEWHCPNMDCPAEIRVRIEHWCSPGAMDISGCDAGLVAKLVGQGLVRDVAELYRLKVGEIAALEGMDKTSAQKIFDALTASLKREGWRTLYGLHIPHVSAADAEVLCRRFNSVDNVFAASVERLMQADGVGEKTARSVVHWNGDSVNRKLVKRLFKIGLNFKADVPPSSAKKPVA